MRRALELGVNWIDTAAVYGLGHSEEVVGKMLRDLPASERPLIFTKCGLTWDEKNPMQQAKRILKPETIRRECEASLRRLGVERFDLYQFHWPDEMGTPIEDSWAEMVKLIEQGKVRAAGVSNFNVELLERCEEDSPRRFPAAAFLDDQPRRRGRCAALVQGHNTGVDLLQPHAIRNL